MGNAQVEPDEERTAGPSAFEGREPFLAAGARDLRDGLVQWRTWYVLAVNDIHMRYRRSKLGQFWLTLSMAATMLGMSLVFSGIMNMPIKDYLLYLGVGLLVWNLISTTLTEAASSFITSDLYLKAYPGPRSAVLNRAMLRSILANAHNFALLPFIWVASAPSLGWSLAYFVPGLVLVIANIYWFGMLFGPSSARFRDIPQILQSVLQLFFFITPIMYKPDSIGRHLSFLVDYNPLASAVEVLRAPLIGQVPNAYHYIMLSLIALAGFTVAIPFYSRFRARIVYWL